MIYLGDFIADQAIYFMWNTMGSAGESITRSGDGTISVYKDNSDGSSFDQTQSITGITNDEDVDGLTGVHSCCITTTNAWYETGHDYTVVLSSSTIDGESVNAVIAHFSIENRYMRGTDSAALAATALTNVTWTDAKAAFLNHSISTVDTVVDGIQTDLSNATDGLGAIKALIDTMDAIVDIINTNTTAIDVLTEAGGSGDLTAIKTQVDAILDLNRDSGVVSVTNVETTLFEDAAPTKNKVGVVVKIDMAALASGDTFIVKEKYKDESGGSYQMIDSQEYTGAQTNPLRIIALTPYRYGAIITMQRTAGTNRSIEWESFVEE